MSKLTIIVCSYNRDRYILKTLEHLKNQNAEAGSFSVILVNNNSTDATDIICKDFFNKNESLGWKYVNETKVGLSHARNRGIEEAITDLICFIDDDAFATESYAQEAIKFFDKYPVARAFGGKIIPSFESKSPDWMSKFLLPIIAALDMGEKVKSFKNGKFPLGANMGFRKDIFKEYGTFNTALGRKGLGLGAGEEKDLFYRMAKGGAKILYAPQVVVNHFIPNSRLNIDYIRNQAIGVGQSELIRLKSANAYSKFNKIISEFIKISGTLVLSLFYGLTFRIPKAIMLIRFRYWVTLGLLGKV